MPANDTSMIKMDRVSFEGTRQFLVNARPQLAVKFKNLGDYLPNEKAFELSPSRPFVKTLIVALKAYHRKHGEVIGYGGSLQNCISYWAKIEKRMSS